MKNLTLIVSATALCACTGAEPPAASSSSIVMQASSTTQQSSSSVATVSSSSLAASSSSNAPMIPPLDRVDPNEQIGWSMHTDCGPNGTTGGEGGDTVTVTNGGDFKSAFNGNDRRIIMIEGRISGVGGIKGSNKTVIGKSGAAIIGGVVLSGSKNNIFRNIEFADGSNDTFEHTGSTCTWFDHNTFRDGKDGNLDIVRGSNYVTVSWNKFYYTRGHGHMLSNLNGNSDGQTGDKNKIKVTFHHNWWGAGVQERMPRVRYGDVHVFNNYYKYEKVANDRGQNYIVGAGHMSRVLVEGNYFDGSKDPIRFFETGHGNEPLFRITAEIVHRDNEFVNTTGAIAEYGNAFAPPYTYSVDEAKDIKEIVTKGAGPK